MLQLSIILATAAAKSPTIVSQATEVLSLTEKYGVTLVALVFVVIFCVFLVKYIIKTDRAREEKQDKKFDELLKKFGTPYDKRETDHLKDYAKNASMIQQFTTDLKYKLSSDRVSVFEYHNGGKSVAGVDFNKCSVMYESTSEGTEGKYSELQGIPLSLNFLWIKLLSEQKPIIISNIDTLKEHDATIYSSLKQNGLKSYYSRLILNYDSKPIGFIVLEYFNNMKTLNQEEMKLLSDTSLKIAGLLIR